MKSWDHFNFFKLLQGAEKSPATSADLKSDKGNVTPQEPQGAAKNSTSTEIAKEGAKEKGGPTSLPLGKLFWKKVSPSFKIWRVVGLGWLEIWFLLGQLMYSAMHGVSCSPKWLNLPLSWRLLTHPREKWNAYRVRSMCFVGKKRKWTSRIFHSWN